MRPTNLTEYRLRLWPTSEPASLPVHQRWRRVADILKISKAARSRLEWIIYYQACGGNVSLTCRHFGIARKTFYKWWREFDEDNLYSLYKLEDRSRAPRRVRQRQITLQQELRILALRRRYLRYGKEKLAVIYAHEYGEPISAWKIQKTIEKHQLYYHPKKQAHLARKRVRARAFEKKRLTQLAQLRWYEKKAGYIICLDGLTIYWQNLKRHIFTAIDKYGKVAFARMYTNKSSQSAEDFLFRLHYLLDGQIPRVGHDNGSEFGKLFRSACRRLDIEQYYTRVRTPQDNADNERFNRTLREEFLAMGNLSTEVAGFNRRLTDWLIEYNFRRPHRSLGYKTPVEFSKVLPVYSSCTLA